MKVIKGFCCAGIFFLWLFTGFAGRSEPSTNAVSLDSLPAAVQKTVRAQAGAGKLGDIQRDEEDGDVSYDFSVTKGEDERSYTVGADGKLISAEVSLSETPSVVQKTIKQQVGNGEIDEIDKVTDDGEPSYEVDFTKKDGTDSSCTVGADGKLQSVQMTLAELPAAIRETVSKQPGELGDIFKTFDDDEISYAANITRRGHDFDFSVAADGNLESKEVILSELPPGARKTVEEKIGGGKILRIDEIFEKRDGVFPFQVDARKDGKPFNFSVGPKGRFFGMDE